MRYHFRGMIRRVISRSFRTFSTITPPPPNPSEPRPDTLHGLITVEKSVSLPPAGSIIFPIIDTWHWVHSLSSNGTLTHSQSTALTHTFLIIAHHRLTTWQSNLPTAPHLHHSTHLLRSLAAELDRLHTATTTRLSMEASRLAGETEGELAVMGEELREGIGAVRGEGGLAMGAWRGEGREEVGRMEMEQHRLEGMLAGSMSRFRSEAETVKVRSMFTFAMTIAQKSGNSSSAASTSSKPRSKGKRTEEDTSPDEM